MDAMDQVRRATKAREKADREFNAAIVAAHAGGGSYRKIAAECGLSFQRVAQIVAAAKPAEVVEPAEPTVEQMRARLDVLDARWDKLVDGLVGKQTHEDKIEQARRNKRKPGKKARNPLPLVSQERRVATEGQMLAELDRHPEDPVVRRIVGELAEADALRERLAALVGDSDIPF